MANSSVWGPPIWKLFHVLLEKITEESFPKLYLQLFQLIKKICSNLPCPECSLHATTFLSKIRIEQISTKNDFKNMLYVFHNKVNLRRNKSLFPYAEMQKYKNQNLISIYNNFIIVYNTKGNMNLLIDSFQRQLVLKEFKKWIITNITHFQ
jgi:hypothetical protein